MVDIEAIGLSVNFDFLIYCLKWTPKTGQQFKWDTVTRNVVRRSIRVGL